MMTMAANRAWHYTSGAGLVGIFNSKAIWATQIQYLNDRHEYLFVYQVAARLVTALFEFRDEWAVRSPKLADAIERRIVSVAGSHERNSPPSIFVISFSTVQDSLSQWRAYGGGPGDTYTVEFDTDALIDLANSRGWRYEECRYGEAAISDDVVDKMRSLFRDFEGGRWAASTEPEEEALRTLIEGLIDVAAVAKDEGFTEEREFRLISPREPAQEVLFRQGATTILPYVEFDLAERGFSVNDGPIRGVGIGPGPNQALALHASLRLQVKANQPLGGATGYQSRIPYRNI